MSAHDEVVTTTMFSDAERAAWQVAIRRGLALTAADLRYMLEAATPLITTTAQEQFAAAARDELAKPLADLGAKIVTDERERIRQLAVEYRAVYFTGNQKDGIEPHPFADLIEVDT